MDKIAVGNLKQRKDGGIKKFRHEFSSPE